jgi:hypothetical protein
MTASRNWLSRTWRRESRGGVVRLAAQAVVCAARTVRLWIGGQLHVRSSRVGAHVCLPDGRRFEVFRESTRDGVAGPRPVTLTVWFHLWAIPAGARIHQFLFERLCVANTLLFAGFDGYLVKLWMVDPQTADYAGLYSWSSAEEAETYGRYITAMLRPLSSRGSVGYRVLPDVALEDYLSAGGSELTRGAATGGAVCQYDGRLERAIEQESCRHPSEKPCAESISIVVRSVQP